MTSPAQMVLTEHCDKCREHACYFATTSVKSVLEHADRWRRLSELLAAAGDCDAHQEARVEATRAAHHALCLMKYWKIEAAARRREVIG